MKRIEAGLLVLLLLAAALLGTASLTRGHLWGDDFASYVMQAQSILDGSTSGFIQHNTFTIENSSFPPGPVAYPWGFPALLVPLVAVFGLKFLALKLINPLFFLLFLAVFYWLARRRLPVSVSLGLTAALTFSPALLIAQDLVSPDIPFLFASTLAVLLIELRLWNSLRGAALIGLAIYFAFSLRTNGILLLAPLITAQIVGREGGWRRALTPWLVFTAAVVIESLLLPSGQGSYLSHFSMFTAETFFHNLWFYLHFPAALMEDIPFGSIFLVPLILLFLYDLIVNFRRERVMLSYIAASLGTFTLWPENQGIRLVYPLLPLFLILAGGGWVSLMERVEGRQKELLRWASISLGAAFLLLSLIFCVNLARINLRQGREINGPLDPVSRQMFEFIREETPPGSVIVFFKPRAMRLFTDRDSFMTQNCGDLAKGDYIVFHEKQGFNAQIADLEACPGFDYPVVFNNLRFTVYEVLH